MVSAKGVLRTEGFPYALDNGAWWSFCHKLPFDGASFMAAYRKLGPLADFVVLPDIVAGGHGSLAFSMKWRADLGQPVCQLVLAVQDGMAPRKIAGIVGPSLGIFVGGSTDFKLSTMPIWAEIARERKAYLHVGRVNTARRIALCAAINADSFDGSSASRYAVTLPGLDLARRQPDLFA
jgi:hypothetical protein